MKIIGKIFASVYSAIYFFILTILMTITFALNLFSTNYYTDIVKSINLKTIKISDFGDYFNNDNIDENATVEDALVSYFKESGVEEDLAKSIINNNKIREVIGEFIGNYMNYNIGGEKPTIAKEDVEAIFNEPDIKKLLDQSPEKMETDIDIIYNELNNLANEIIESGGVNYDNSKGINTNSITN